MLDHPGNPNHPTVWHCRNDGWAGASFNQQAPFTLEAGKTLILRYRLYLHSGDAIESDVARRFAEFSAAPQVTLRLRR